MATVIERQQLKAGEVYILFANLLKIWLDVIERFHEKGRLKGQTDGRPGVFLYIPLQLFLTWNNFATDWEYGFEFPRRPLDCIMSW